MVGKKSLIAFSKPALRQTMGGPSLVGILMIPRRLGLMPRLIALLGILSVFATAVNAKQDTQIAELVRKLDAETYELRDEASKQLAALGVEILPELESALESASPETCIRGLNLIRALAMSNDESTHEASVESLRRLASDNKNPSVALRAQRTIDELDTLIKQKVATRLAALGMALEYETISKNGRLIDVVASAKVDASWVGTEVELAELFKLDDIRSITFDHPSVNDETIKGIRNLNLDRIVIRKADITDSAVQRLRGITSLSELAILYCPIDEKKCCDSENLSWTPKPAIDRYQYPS